MMEEKEAISLNEHKKIVDILHEELLRKDNEIEKLKLENQMLIKTALKRSEELNNLQKKLLSSVENLPSKKSSKE